MKLRRRGSRKDKDRRSKSAKETMFYILTYHIRHEDPKFEFYGMVPAGDCVQLNEKKSSLRFTSAGFDESSMRGTRFALVGRYYIAIGGRNHATRKMDGCERIFLLDTFDPKAEWSSYPLTFNYYCPMLGVSGDILYILPSLKDQYRTVKNHTEVFIFDTRTFKCKELCKLPAKRSVRACHALDHGRLLVAMDGDDEGENFITLDSDNATNYSFCTGWQPLPKFKGRTSFTVLNDILYILDNPAYESDLDRVAARPCLYAYDIRGRALKWQQVLSDFDPIMIYDIIDLSKTIEIVPLSDSILCFVWAQFLDPTAICYRNVEILQSPTSSGTFARVVKEEVLQLKESDFYEMDHIMGYLPCVKASGKRMKIQHSSDHIKGNFCPCDEIEAEV